MLQKKNNFEFCTNIPIEFSFMELKDELEEVNDMADITPEHLQDEKIGPLIIIFNKKLK